MRIASGTPWEEQVGYARAVTAGPWVLVAGTTSTVDGVVAHVGDAYRQSLTAFGIALDALRGCGAGAEDVVRTRMYIMDMALQEEVGRAHRELFGAIRPVATMVAVVGLTHPDHLVEVEVTAYRGPST